MAEPTFHINPTTGNPGLCRAEAGNCPYKDSDGNPAPHYSSKEEARAAFEAANPTFEEDKPYANISYEELQALEIETLARHRAEGTPLTEEEYDRHYEYIRRVRATEPSTHKQHTSKVKGKVVYSPERLAQHEDLMATIEARYAHVPKERKAMMTGGISGSGKTTQLRLNKDLNAKSYATLSIDEIKEVMAEKGMTPNIPGLLPLETDDLIKYEATVISKSLFDRFSEKGTNILFDKTMAGESPLRAELEDLKERGYKPVTAVFVDVAPADAHERIRGRHKAGIDRWLTTGEGYGERAVSGGAIAGAMSSNPAFRSKNAEVFHRVAQDGLFGELHIFDSSDNGRKISLDEFEGHAQR